MPMEPTASRPYMPGYGVQGPDAGTGLLPWAWAVERLTASHDYWVATVRPGAGCPASRWRAALASDRVDPPERSGGSS